MTTLYFSKLSKSHELGSSSPTLFSLKPEKFPFCFVLFHVTLHSDLYSYLGSNILFHFHSTFIQLNLNVYCMNPIQ